MTRREITPTSSDAAVIAQREVYRAQALCIAYKAATDDQARRAVLHAIGEAAYTALEALRDEVAP